MKRLFSGLAVLLITASILVFPSAAAAAESPKVDKKIPVYATDVELAPKVLVKGPDKAAKPPRAAATAATGTLGTTMGDGKKYAIVIGISNYPGTANDLTYCDDDAEDMAAALNGYGLDSITVISNLNATRIAIMTAIENLGKVALSRDEVVFFYSGHGGRGKANDYDKEVTDECIWAHDGSSLVPIWDGELATAFAGYQTNRIVFIFDSCYAGGMTDLAKPGRVVAMASSENTLSYEFSSLANGEFTYYMIQKGMSEHLADRFDSITGYDVTVEEAWDYAKLNCRYDSITINDGFTNDLLP